MKTKPKNFGNFFVRVGAGFLAFWLLTMSAFSLLLGQQRAKLMLKDMENKSDYWCEDFADSILNKANYPNLADDEEMRKSLANQAFRAEGDDTPDLEMFETAIVDMDGRLLQSNRWCLTLKDGDTLYKADMDGQPQEVFEALYDGGNIELIERAIPQMTFEAWVDGDKAYLKSITVRQLEFNGEAWLPAKDANTVECVYDEEKVKDLPLKTMGWEHMVYPSPDGITAKQLAASMSSPARMALRRWAENPKGAYNREQIVRPWLVRTYQCKFKHSDFIEGGGWVYMSVAAESYPIKACLPILVPVWTLSLILAMLCAIILSFALLRVWRKQERIERVRRETTAALAHELKTPLSVLSATAELLGDNLAPEKQAHYLGVIQQQAQRMDGSVRHMLELSRLETGAKALRRTAFSLAELAQERLQAALPTDSTIRTEFAAQGKFEVNADRALLTRALDALLENAVQHTPEGGCITVHLADGVLSVTNTGDAIPADALPRLWEAYYQADPSRSAKGDGLGLSIAKTVFDLHGFTCGAENTEIGPKFWFRFADK